MCNHEPIYYYYKKYFSNVIVSTDSIKIDSDTISPPVRYKPVVKFDFHRRFIMKPVVIMFSSLVCGITSSSYKPTMKISPKYILRVSPPSPLPSSLPLPTLLLLLHRWRYRSAAATPSSPDSRRSPPPSTSALYRLGLPLLLHG